MAPWPPIEEQRAGLAPRRKYPYFYPSSTSVGDQRRGDSWCTAGAARGRVFVAGGVCAGYEPAVACSGALWDPAASPPAAAWAPILPPHDERFSRDAAEAVCSGGKVCMVNLRGRGAKECVVFDLRADRWEDMPPGMFAGWKGPAAASLPDDGETIYVVDEERGALTAYDWGTARWRMVAESERLKGATVGELRARRQVDEGAKGNLSKVAFRHVTFG
uniref:F-box/kelch-repeat protein n=1 Tax=Oryza rufipogon TaxID=4529 RepID=A0A0E0MXQ7_ORYRU